MDGVDGSRPEVTQRATRRHSTNLTLGGAFSVFFSNLNAWLLVGAMLAALVWRGAQGSYTWWDLLIPMFFIAFQPFQEWLIHVHVLHWRPRRVFGVWLDPELCRKHRAHHRDPSNVPNIFIPRRTLLALLPLHVALWWAITPTPQLMATGLLVTFTSGVVYEWTHFIIHTTYKPRTRLYKRIFRYHRLHHFKNENYWFGVTAHSGDRLLRTLPAPRAVRTSPTARDLGGLAAAGIDR
jgi:hypothetical protein